MLYVRYEIDFLFSNHVDCCHRSQSEAFGALYLFAEDPYYRTHYQKAIYHLIHRSSKLVSDAFLSGNKGTPHSTPTVGRLQIVVVCYSFVINAI